MKRRLTIARSLINDPEILLLDEPTTGLDPQARHVLWDRLYRLKQNGVTLVLTTHYMDEAEQLCDRLVVMDGGRFVAEGSPAGADRRALHPRGRRAALRRRATTPRPHGRLEPSSAATRERVEELPDRVLLYVADGEHALARAHEIGLRPVSSLVRRSTLEDVFLRLTGRSWSTDEHRRRAPPSQPRRVGLVGRRVQRASPRARSGVSVRRSSACSRRCSTSSPLGVGLGTVVDDNGTPLGVKYLVFVAPAFLTAAALQIAAGDASFPVMAGFKWQRVFHGMAATPLTSEADRRRPPAVDHAAADREFRCLPGDSRLLRRRRRAGRSSSPSRPRRSPAPRSPRR